MMKHYVVLAAATALFTFEARADNHATDASAMAEADREAAEAIFQKSCRACHGNNAQGA